MSYQKISYEKRGDVALVLLNDPATLNAMSGTMGTELLAATRRAQSEARALVIGSVGRGFCSGANLAEGFDMHSPDRDAGEHLQSIFNPLLLEIRSSPIPILTAVRGAAAGVGCGIALSGDMIVAGESAILFQAFRHVGLSPDGGSSYMLARTIGRVRAMEMMLLGTKVKAAQALEWGLVNRVVADELVDETALALAAQLAAGPASLALIRKAAWSALDADLATQLQLERDYQRTAGRTDDFIEGVTAFQERREARFTGN